MKIEDFVRIFRKDISEFEKQDKQEVMGILFEILQNEKLLNEAIEEIKEDIRNDNKKIFTNLLFTMPFSTKIVEKFLELKYLDDEDIYEELKILFNTHSKILEILQKIKRKLKDKKFTSVDIDEKLKDVEKELNKHQEIFEKEKILDKKLKELKKIQNQERSLEVLEKEIESLKKAKKEYETLVKEVEKSKKIFANLPKDESL